MIDTDGDVDDLVAIRWAIDHLGVRSLSVVHGRVENPAVVLSSMFGARVTHTPDVRDGDDLVSIGPLADMGADPTLPDRVRRFVVMGGATSRSSGWTSPTMQCSPLTSASCWRGRTIPSRRACSSATARSTT